MKTKSLLLETLLSATLLGATLSAPLALHAESAALSSDTVAKAKEDALYSEGTRAINDGHWTEAEAIFSKIAQQHGDRAEAALYWKAYAENKEGKSARALETCVQLRQAYPHGNWIDECGALEIEVRGKNGNPLPPQAEQDEELKLLALNSLMQQDQSRALPAIQQILEGDHSEKLKDRALFVLAQNQSQQAQTVLVQIAHGQKDPALQRKAIQMIAISNSRQAAAMLADVYRQSANEEVKKAVLQAYFITGTPDPLVEAARHESDPHLAKSAVENLGAMGATSQLLTLYHETGNAEIKRDIINALIAAGPKGADALGNIATSEQDPELRRRATRNLGVAGGMSAAPSLVAAYKKSSDAETKKAAVQALFLANDSHDLVELARAEKDPSLRRAIVQQLSIMQSKEAAEYMLEVLNK